ncbi:MAG: hypothetical protein REI11_14705 [Patulibacter sp.]|nr:hypothetical protein [Patulibacter sp.]
MSRKPVQLPDLLVSDGALPHTGAVVPDPEATPTPKVTPPRRPRAQRASSPASKPAKRSVAVPAIKPAAIASVLGGPITRVDVQVPVGVSNWLRSSTRPEHTGLPRSLGARTPASSLLTAAVELLAESGMDLSKLGSSDPEAVTAAFRTQLQAAASAKA